MIISINSEIINVTKIDNNITLTTRKEKYVRHNNMDYEKN